MEYTVSDFYNSYSDKISLLAGEGGLSRGVRSVGILDYEMLPQLKGKFLHSNFHADQLVISTLLYAKDNPFLITDAVKHLISKDAAGLIVKNVFRLQIPETVLRFAESRNFPIMVTESKELYVERMVYQVMRDIEKMASDQEAQNLINRILLENTGEEEALECAKILNPSFENQVMAAYIDMENLEEPISPEEVKLRYPDDIFSAPETAIMAYRKGLLFIYTWEQVPENMEKKMKTLLKELRPGSDAKAGISEVHYYLGEIKSAIKEAIYATVIEGSRNAEGSSILKYGDLGIAKAIIPFLEQEEMQRFSRGILEIIENFDAENNGNLLETLEYCCKNSFSLRAAAVEMGQHVNTVRYRLEKIAAITGLDFKDHSDAMELDLAWKIRQYSEVIGDKIGVF